MLDISRVPPYDDGKSEVSREAQLHCGWSAFLSVESKKRFID